MGKLIKYLLYLAGGLIVLILAAVLIVPRVIDVQKYKPMLIDQVAAVTGRPVTLGGDLNLSLFPWVGVSFSDLQLGNPQGYEAESFVRVKSFEAHVKVMPLLSKEVQIDSFVLDGPEIYLEMTKEGKGNWEGLGGAVAKEKEPEKQKTDSSGGFALKSIEIGKFAILNGIIRYVDKQQGLKKEITALNLTLNDVSLERPIGLTFKAVIDGNPIGLAGSIGPVGAKPGQGTLPLDLTLNALDEFEAKLAGKLNDPATSLSYDLALDVAQFSPRKVMEALGISFPVETADEKALNSVALKLKVAGSTSKVVISDGTFSLDSSTFGFKGSVDNFAPLHLVFEGNLDSIDLDRYLPPKKEQSETGTAKTETAEPKPIDYDPLRRLKVDTTVTVGELRVQGGKVENILVKVTADKGVIKLNPFSMELYSGKVNSTATVDVNGREPVTAVNLNTSAVQVGPLLKDFTKKEILEGALLADIALTLKGDTPEVIKKNLNGKGELLFRDGAIVGIDLAAMVRNVQTSFGLAEKTAEKPRTDFAELKAPFTIKNGLVNTPDTYLQSPLIRLTVQGEANLVSEVLDMKVRPKFVASLKGQGDTEQRSGLMVPVLVKGTFTQPQFRPDLEGIVQSQLQGQIPDSEGVKKAIEQELAPEKILKKEGTESVEKTIKGLIPKFSFD
jgi:AsmA protein